ncbi:unnamed protein product [Mycena citricolor]|uniref:Uncharacterized protein n=1 Tax=Mycena citricolor TaxID=2018698 RepID=A0AAD2JZF7_9AGAR|nr:unnamed protein product [Mycena citricolor]
MPKVSLRRQLIDGAYTYARRLRAWRRQQLDRRDREQEEQALGWLGGDEGLGEDIEQPGSSMDVSDVSDVSSISFVSASTGPESDGFDSESEETRQYQEQYAAIQERIQQLEGAQTLKPKTKVPKQSQLNLVLVLYCQNDPIRFQRNLCVAPDTFNGIVRKIKNDAVSGGEQETGQRQLPVD